MYVRFQFESTAKYASLMDSRVSTTLAAARWSRAVRSRSSTDAEASVKLT